ncbi:hypothetical protein LINGRAHAP2_LOCUS10612 [Linum grandiflorum]
MKKYEWRCSPCTPIKPRVLMGLTQAFIRSSSIWWGVKLQSPVRNGWNEASYHQMFRKRQLSYSPKEPRRKQ